MDIKKDLVKLFGLIGAGLVIYQVIKPGKQTKNKFNTKKSDCTKDFLNFNENLTIKPERVQNLKSAHSTIRKKVRQYFQRETNLPIPDFYIQGSYKMKTLIDPLDSHCDVDLGVFFPEKPKVEFKTLQKYLSKALVGHTSQGVMIKQNCVRLNYVNDFHIDLPVYYLDNRRMKLYFGSQANGWVLSDPKNFIDWFKLKTLGKTRIVRTIRYLKAWASYTKYKTGKKMPSGLALTLWCIKYYKNSPRDDLAFILTSVNIYRNLEKVSLTDWELKMPVAPFDNILDRYSSQQRNNFKNEFKEMINISLEAANAQSNYAAKIKWRKIFGYQFN